jgi:hypothetical protein
MIVLGMAVSIPACLIAGLAGYAFCLLGFLTMLVLWKDHIPYWRVGLGYALVR